MKRISQVLILTTLSTILWAAPKNNYEQGVELYKAGRLSEATEAFERAIKKKENLNDSKDYVERIRRETVERIRNRALTGISKSTWQTKFYFMNSIDNRIRVGISMQELFDRNSANFRPGAVDALSQLATILQRSDGAFVDIDFITEIPQDKAPNPDILSQQMGAVYSLLSQTVHRAIPKP